MARRSLRLIGRRDRAAVIRMWLALFAAQQHDGGLGRQVTDAVRLETEIAGWVDRLIGRGECLGLVAARGDEMLGFIALALHHRPWLIPAGSATISALWVEPHERRRRVGQQLVAAAARRLLKRGIDTIDLHALPFPHAAALFWRRMGFAEQMVSMRRQTRMIPTLTVPNRGNAHMEPAFIVTAPPLPNIAGFNFTIGGTITKISMLMYTPDPQHVVELIDLIRTKGVPCQTAYLRCDRQGDFSQIYINTQCQLGGSEVFVKRTEPSKQSTTFTQVNIHIKAWDHKMVGLALSAAHHYSCHTQKVVTIDLAAGSAVVGVGKSSAGVINLSCSLCKFAKTVPASSVVPEKCPQCKKGNVISG
jgi:GNAT superfamily N-acetyltransferase